MWQHARLPNCTSRAVMETRFGLLPSTQDCSQTDRRTPAGRVEDWRGAPKVQPSWCSLFPLGVPQYPNREPVSNPRLVTRSMRISRTTRSCLLRVEGYVTYRAGATFSTGFVYRTQ